MNGTELFSVALTLGGLATLLYFNWADGRAYKRD